jgi:hypothetical protein
MDVGPCYAHPVAGMCSYSDLAVQYEGQAGFGYGHPDARYPGIPVSNARPDKGLPVTICSA